MQTRRSLEPSRERLYADHASAAPLRDGARDAMLPWLEGPENPNSVHAEGRRARAALDEARAAVASLLGAAPRDVVFTASGSEAVTLALVGFVRACPLPVRLLTSAVEHRAVLAAVDALRDDGVSTVLLPVDGDGRISLEVLAAELARGEGRLQLVAQIAVNNELGTIADLDAVVEIARRFGALVFSDAIATAGCVDAAALCANVDAFCVSSAKFGGPAGAAVLVARNGWNLAPVIHGGGQERGRRAGTQNVAAIVGAAAALASATAECAEEASRLAAARERFEARIVEALDDVRINASGAPRAPHITNLSIGGLESDALVAALDLAGLAVSAGSACESGAVRRSHVVDAVAPGNGAPLRFSWGYGTTEAEVERAAAVTIATVERMRLAASLPG